MPMKLVSMKRSAEDKREDMGNPVPPEAVGPDYPWGLCINMDSDELDKLGIKTLPDLNTEMTITAKVKVTRREESSQMAMYDGGDESERRCLSLQITDMAIE